MFVKISEDGKEIFYSEKNNKCYLVAFTKVSSSTTLNAHLNQHYYKDEDGKPGHGSAVGGYMIMLSAVSKCC
jgi:hypothetical protein